MFIAQIRKLDDTEFRNPWARAYIRVTFPLMYVEFLICGYKVSQLLRGLCEMFMDS